MAKVQQNKQVKAQPKQQNTPRKKPVAGTENVLLYGIIVAVLTLIAFFPAFSNEFTNWDDEGYVVNNRLIRSLEWDNIKLIFSKYVEGNYHPLTILSYAIEYKLTGMDIGDLHPKVFHFTNNIFHVANAVMVFLFLRSLTGQLYLAFIAGLLFGVHPMHAESVAWISERKDVLYTFFFLLTLIVYTRHAKNPDEKPVLRIVTCVILFTLSLLSKGQAVTLSVILVLIDYYLGRGFTKRVMLEKVPFFILSIGFGALAVVAQHATNAIQDNEGFTLIDRIFFASYGLTMYIGKALVPIKQSNFYPYPYKDSNMNLPTEFYFYPIIAIAFVALLIWLYRRDKKEMVFGLAFFAFTVGPVLQLMAVGSTIMCDRYSYIPYIGLFVILGYILQWVHAHKKSMFMMTFIGFGVFSSIMVFAAQKRSVVWKNSKNLWTDCISKYPQVAVAHNNLGLVYKDETNYPKALESYINAEKADPSYQPTYENRGNIYFLTGKYELALKDLEYAIKLKPTSEVAHNSRGAVLFNQGKVDEAITEFDFAIKQKPDYAEAYRNRGSAYSVKTRYKDAEKDYDIYLTYDPKLALVWYWRGIARQNLGNVDGALKDYAQALAINPKSAEVYVNRARLLASQKRGQEALQDLQAAQNLGASIDPSLFQMAQAAMK